MPKKCTPMWRETDFEVNMYKRHSCRTLVVSMSKKCTPLWREPHFEVKKFKTHQCRSTFGSFDVEKEHAIVVRNIFPSQNVQNTQWSHYFWKLRCRTSAGRCGAKHICKSKVSKTDGLRPLLKVQFSKKR